MASVTWKSQPGLFASATSPRRRVPLAGSSHLYTVTRVLWPESIGAVLEGLLVGRTLHVCCGESRLGDVRLDLDPAHEPDIVADAAEWLSGADPESFDTVLCDPPYVGRYRWNHALLAGLSRVARRRIIFQHWFVPVTPHGRYKKAHDRFGLSEVYVWQPRTYFGRAQVISVFDQRPGLVQLPLPGGG